MQKNDLIKQLTSLGIKVQGGFVKRKDIEKVLDKSFLIRNLAKHILLANDLTKIPLPPDLQGSFNSKPLLSNVVSALAAIGSDKCKNALANIWMLINPDKPIPRSDDWMSEGSDEIERGEHLDWKSIVRPSNAVLKDPKIVTKYKGLDRHPKGYFRTIQFDPDVIAKAIYPVEHDMRDDGDYIFSAWKKGELSPIITIDNHLGDGSHRCMLAYWLGVDVAVVELNI
jgi:hypothetical protein